MNRLVLAAVLAAVALPAAAALQAGAPAPDFSTQASLDGKEFTFSLAEARSKGPVVVYFYPSAYTGGCNVQARAFAEDAAKFAAAGASIVGVSRNRIEDLNAFSADPEYCAGKFPVASDADGAIAAAYDLKTLQGPPGLKDTRGKAIEHAFTERTTFVVRPDGSIAATLSSADDKIAPVDHSAKALEIVEGLGKR
jgi:peroxiredoxin Q/BCP